MFKSALLFLILLVPLALVPPAQAEPVSLRGEVTYRERLDLPPGVELRVRLVDRSLPGDPAVVEAAGAIASPGGVPLAFTLTFDDRLVDPEHDYALIAEIAAGNAVWFTNAEPFAVDPLAAAPASIVLAFVGRTGDTPPDPVAPLEATAGPILDIVWRATELGGEPLPPDAGTSLSIAGDMRAGGRGGCNSYFAQVWLQGDNLQFSEIAATRMACADPGATELEARYFAALGATRFWRLVDGELHLLDAAGRELVQLVPAGR